ncbi:hypothetical protein HKA50_000858 [Escherichia coli]|nr:hypothetical protein [Escherichia coli]EFG1887612.1 hypothetical protein [Escherichia coli]EFN2112033.1 hypothetical protein [Escherichia coli]
MFPAPAGINRGTEHAVYISTSVPRASGDKPDAAAAKPFPMLSSPRQRG